MGSSRAVPHTQARSTDRSLASRIEGRVVTVRAQRDVKCLGWPKWPSGRRMSGWLRGLCARQVDFWLSGQSVRQGVV